MLWLGLPFPKRKNLKGTIEGAVRLPWVPTTARISTSKVDKEEVTLQKLKI